VGSSTALCRGSPAYKGYCLYNRIPRRFGRDVVVVGSGSGSGVVVVGSGSGSGVVVVVGSGSGVGSSIGVSQLYPVNPSSQKQR